MSKVWLKPVSTKAGMRGAAVGKLMTWGGLTLIQTMG